MRAARELNEDKQTCPEPGIAMDANKASARDNKMASAWL